MTHPEVFFLVKNEKWRQKAMPGAFEIVMEERKALVDKIIEMMRQGYY